MAIALPVFVTDASVATGLKLPKYATDASVATGLALSKFVTDASVATGLALPAFQVQLPLNFTHVPAGGTTIGGGAVIVGDPFIATGGTLVGGVAVVLSTSVLIFTLYPSGGVLMAGAPDGTFVWTTFKPSSGMVIRGAAPSSSPSALITPSGGVKIGGAVLDSIFVPTGKVLVGGTGLYNFLTGGALIGGAAVVSAPLNFTQAPTGGALIAGAASVQHVQPVVPAGGTLVGGLAVVRILLPVAAVSGGTRVAGSAVMYFLPAGTVSTTENPFADEFPGWVMNYETRAPSRYLGLPANSICRFSGKTYVANAGGIYEVTGTDDAGQPIHAAVTLPKTDFDDSHNKRIPDVFLSVRSAGTLLLKVLANDKAGRYYGVTANPSYVRGTRAKLGKGLEARYWQFRLENMAGADFELADMEIKPTILTRHGV